MQVSGVMAYIFLIKKAEVVTYGRNHQEDGSFQGILS